MNLRSIIGQSDAAKQAVTICLVFLMLLLISSVFHFATQWPTRAQVGAGPGLGELRFAPDERGDCRTIKFDSRSVEIEEDRVIDCHLDSRPRSYLGPFESLQKRLNGR